MSNGDVSMKFNELLDIGSDSTLVTKALADILKLESEFHILTLSNAVCSSTKTISKLVNVHLFSRLHPLKAPFFKCMGSRKPRFAEI